VFVKTVYSKYIVSITGSTIFYSTNSLAWTQTVRIKILGKKSKGALGDRAS